MATWQRDVKPLSWTAKRAGPIYCAPACGFRCTWAAYQQAKRDAQALAIRLGKGWTPHVSENMGWFYSAISPCGRLKVHPCIYRGKVTEYVAFLGEADAGGGRWAEHGRTPEAAIKNVIRVATASLKAIGALFLELPGAPHTARKAAMELAR